MRRVKKTKRRHRAGTPWTTGEEELLCELYPTHNNRDLANRFGRSEWAISGKARGLGLTRDHGGGYQRQQSEGCPWSHREIALLRMLYPVMPYEAIAEKIGRSHDAVKMKARRLKLRKMEFWSEAEDRLLRDSHQERSYNRLAQRLGRTVLAVKARAITLGLEAKVPNWTRDEIRFLRNAYGEIDLDVIARELGRTRAATAKKAREIGLVQYRHWSREDVQRLKELYPYHAARELADRLGHSPEAIRCKARQLGLCKQPGSMGPRKVSSQCETTAALPPRCSVSRN